jgi:serine phosphatase RsbU (regulator of sigma subunit)
MRRERLFEAARAMQKAPVGAILTHIVQSADAFVADAPQYDDMTLIVARIG